MIAAPNCESVVLTCVACVSTFTDSVTLANFQRHVLADDACDCDALRGGSGAAESVRRNFERILAGRKIGDRIGSVGLDDAGRLRPGFYIVGDNSSRGNGGACWVR